MASAVTTFLVWLVVDCRMQCNILSEDPLTAKEMQKRVAKKDHLCVLMGTLARITRLGGLSRLRIATLLYRDSLRLSGHNQMDTKDMTIKWCSHLLTLLL